MVDTQKHNSLAYQNTLPYSHLLGFQTYTPVNSVSTELTQCFYMYFYVESYYLYDVLHVALLQLNQMPFIKRKWSGKTESCNIHSLYMKTQHIKFEILNESLSVFKCNLLQLNFVQNILVIGRICDGNLQEV